MAFCEKCGTQLVDGAAFCPNCGAAAAQAQPQPQPQPQPQQPAYQQPDYQAPAPVQETGLKKAIRIFLMIGVICTAIYTCAIGLAWCIPIKNKYFAYVRSGQPVPVGLKVCSLIFVSGIAGILMLCDHN